jgi:Ribbon-helix-helix protein, copG family
VATERVRPVVLSSAITVEEVTVADVLIRDVPPEVLAAIDARAQRVGLSRSEYLRRSLAREHVDPTEVTVADLEQFSSAFADLADDEVMGDAWT